MKHNSAISSFIVYTPSPPATRRNAEKRGRLLATRGRKAAVHFQARAAVAPPVQGAALSSRAGRERRCAVGFCSPSSSVRCPLQHHKPRGCQLTPERRHQRRASTSAPTRSAESQTTRRNIRPGAPNQRGRRPQEQVTVRGVLSEGAETG